MKKLLIISMIMSMLCTVAMADRTVSGDTCATVNEFLNALELGTVADFDCIRQPGYNDNPMQTFALTPNLGAQYVYIYSDGDEINQYPMGEPIHVTGTLVSRGNTGNAYYFDTRGDLGSIEAAHHTPVAYTSQGSFYSSDVRSMWCTDTVAGTGKITAKKEQKSLWQTVTTYDVYCSGGNSFRFTTENDLSFFKNDVITFSGTLSGHIQSEHVITINLIDASLANNE